MNLLESDLRTFQIIADLRTQITDLEAKTIADLPPDAQETVQTFKDRLLLQQCLSKDCILILLASSRLHDNFVVLLHS